MRLLVLLALLAMAGGPAVAAPITFSLSFQGHGTLDGVAFNNVPITIDMLSDTLLSVPFSNTPCCIGYQNFVFPPGRITTFDTGATASIGGVGTVTFTETIFPFVNNTQDFHGLLPGDLGRDARFYFGNAGLSEQNPYDLTTSTTFTGEYQFSGLAGYFTDGGELRLTADFGAPVVFTAQIVPVPAAFWFMASALTVLGGCRSRKRIEYVSWRRQELA